MARQGRFPFPDRGKTTRKLCSTIKASLKPGGLAIIATFGLHGPEKCSGLPVMRYSCESLQSTLGNVGFELIKCVEETHATPWGKPQGFVYNLFKRPEKIDDAE